MIFDLGCCCIVPSGGIYDFYALGGTYRSDIVTDSDNQDMLSRMASCMVVTTGYLTDSPLTRQIGNTHPNISDTALSSYMDGAYMNLWTGGPFIGWDFRVPVSMNLVDSERIWVRHSIAQSGQMSDYFQRSGINGKTGITDRVVGTGVTISGDYLVLQTNNPTTGAYVAWNLPTDTVLWTDNPGAIHYDIDRLFDKTILVTHSGQGYKLESWYKPSVNFNLNKEISYISGFPPFTGGTQVSRSLYITGVDATGEYIRCSEQVWYTGDYPFVNYVEFRIVDDITGYEIDDISGFSVLLRNVEMPYFSGSGAFNNWFNTADSLLHYVNPVNKEIVYEKLLPYTGSYQSGLIGIDFYKYRSSGGIPTGSQMDHKSDAFSIENFAEPIHGYSSIPRYASQTNNPSGSIIVGRLFGNNLLGIFENYPYGSQHAQFAFSEDGETILSYDGSYNQTDGDSENFHSIDVGDDIRDHYGFPLSAWTLDDFNEGYNPPGSSRVNKYHRLYKTIGVDGTDTFLYESKILQWVAEFELPLVEKIKFYQNTLGDDTSGTFFADDLDNYNNTRILPKICTFANRDAPNCFSVQLPREHYRHATGTTNGGSGDFPTGQLSQTVKILYGPPVQETFTIQGLSGYGLITGTAFPAFTRKDFSGYGGDTRPHTLFDYTTGTGFTPEVGRVYDFEYDMVYGTGEVFWEDTFEQMVPYTRFTDVQFNPGYTGVYQSPQTLSTTAVVLHGCKHLPTNTKAASFIHSRNHYVTGELGIPMVSGEAYCKVKIGENVVFNERMWNTYVPVRGPYDLQSTDDDQRTRMTGNYAAFVWFERLFATPQLFHTGDVSSATGWRMHVANHQGVELWGVSGSGHRDWQHPDPHVVDSSDRFFYVKDMFLPYNNVSDSYDFNTSTQSANHPTGGPRFPRYFAVYHNAEYSGAGAKWGFSHDGTARIPAGWFGYTPNMGFPASGHTQEFPSGHYLIDNDAGPLEGHTVKNSALMPLSPSREDWTGFAPTGRYYMITGQDPLFPSGSPPSDDNFPSPHTLVSTGEFNMVNYPGYAYTHFGIPWIDYVSVSGEDFTDVFAPHYIASGTTQSGWF
jgi:hypothetical protein